MLYLREGFKGIGIAVSLMLLAVLVANSVIGHSLSPTSLEQRALEILSEKLGVTVDELQVIHRSYLESEQISCFKIFHIPVVEIHSVCLDQYGYEVDQGTVTGIIRRGILEWFVGKKTRELADQLAKCQPGETVKVGIWLKTTPDVPVVDRAIAVTDRGFQIELERVKDYFSQLRKPIEGFVQEEEGKVRYASELAPLAVVEIPCQLVEKLEQRLDVDVLYEIRTGVSALNRSTYAINADNFWSVGVDGDQSVAIVEREGIDFNHPYLDGFVYCHPDNVIIDEGHATAVAGIVASTHSTYKGVAKGSGLLSGNTGNYEESDLIACTDWAIGEYYARIVNYSFSFVDNGYPRLIDRYLDYQARFNATTFSSAAGNINKGCFGPYYRVTSPGIAYNGLSVGAFYDNNTATASNPRWSDDAMWAYSCYGNPISPHSDREEPDLVAPGVSIYTTKPGSGFRNVTGTSGAAPHVSGAASLMMERKSILKTWPEEVRAILMATAVHNLEGDSRLSQYDGAGGIDLKSALTTIDNSWSGSGIKYASDFPFYFYFYAQSGKRVRVAIAWDSTANASYTEDILKADLDLTIISPSDNYTFNSASYDNSFEIVDFTAPETGTYTAKVTAFRFDGASEFLGWASLIIPSSYQGYSVGEGEFLQPQPEGAAELQLEQIQLSSNPLGGERAVFTARGQGIESVKVEIFDLSGRRVFDSGLERSNTLTWNLSTNAGDLVANGVYLYIVTVRGSNGEVIRSRVRKLVVLR